MREADVWLPGATVHLVKPQSKLPWPAADLHVVNYDILQRHTESLMELRARALVLDESQYIKNPAAKRTKAALALSKEALWQGAHVLLLTGTPVLNRPVELVTQMEALGVKLAGLSSSSFKERYCGPVTFPVKGGKTITKYDGAFFTLLPILLWSSDSGRVRSFIRRIECRRAAVAPLLRALVPAAPQARRSGRSAAQAVRADGGGAFRRGHGQVQAQAAGAGGGGEEG